MAPRAEEEAFRSGLYHWGEEKTFIKNVHKFFQDTIQLGVEILCFNGAKYSD